MADIERYQFPINNQHVQIVLSVTTCPTMPMKINESQPQLFCFLRFDLQLFAGTLPEVLDDTMKFTEVLEESTSFAFYQSCGP